MAMAMAMAMTTRQRLSEVNPNGVTHFMEKLIGKIYEHFDDDYLTDVIFELTNPAAVISAHRLILSSASEYFQELFRSDEGICPLIEINDIDSDTFERLVTFCYTGKVLITTENMEKMLNAAVILKLDDAVAECTDFILNHVSNLTLDGAYSLEGAAQCEIVEQKIFEYQIKNFMEIAQSEEFLNFDAKNVQKIIERDDLNIQREEDAFKAIKRWYEHDPPARQHQLPDLISSLRLTQIDTDFLLKHIQPLPGCENIVLKTLSWANCPTSRAQISLKFTNPRTLQLEYSHSKAFLAMHVGDYKGKIFQYNSAENSWHEYFNIKLDIYRFQSMFMDNNLIFTGGTRGQNSVADVRNYSFDKNTFKQLPSMRESRTEHCVVTLNNKMYALGGLDVRNKVLRSVESYTELTGWTSITNMNTERAWAGAVILDGKIYVMGGMNSRCPRIKTVECYDPNTNCWTRCADMNEGRFNFGVAAYKQQIYVVGGIMQRAVERYNPQINEWTKICSLDNGSESVFAISIDNQLWTVGGCGTNRVAVYDEQSNQWIEKKPVPLKGTYYCFTVSKALLKNF